MILLLCTSSTSSSLLNYKYPSASPCKSSSPINEQADPSCPKCPQQGPGQCLRFLMVSIPSLGLLSLSFPKVILSWGFPIVKLWTIPSASSTSGRINESDGQLYAISFMLCVDLERSLIRDNTMAICSQATSSLSSVSIDSVTSVEAMDSNNWILSECSLVVAVRKGLEQDELTLRQRLGRYRSGMWKQLLVDRTRRTCLQSMPENSNWWQLQLMWSWQGIQITLHPPSIWVWCLTWKQPSSTRRDAYCGANTSSSWSLLKA